MRLNNFLDTLIKSELSPKDNEEILIQFQKCIKKLKNMVQGPVND